MRAWIAVLAACALGACASIDVPTPSFNASAERAPQQDQFFAALSALCGQAFAGRVVTTDPADAGFANQPLVMHVRECSADEIRIPFYVGDDRSRTWVITRTAAGLRLKHDHRHEDGAEDVLSQYGGDTATAGAPTRQDFPADAFSQRLFRANNIPASVDNIWALELQPQALFAYELNRPNRHFRVQFDLTTPIAPPPPPWGAREAAD